jgi:prepilin-type processing-associated H-X9-DG protein
MERRRRRLSFIELLAAVSLIAVLGAVLLPGLARSREAARRASCANNLKQMGIVFKMYANEWNGRWPTISPVPSNWIVDMREVYPEYLSDLSVLICPSSPFADAHTFRLRDDYYHPGARIGSYHPDCVSSLFYNYTGFTIQSSEMAVALFDAYYVTPPAVFAAGDVELDIPVWAVSDRGDGQAGVPVLWDRVSPYGGEFSHTPVGGNVLYMDGHVEFVPYSYYNDWSYFPMTPVGAETFGSVIPRLSSDCYEF